MTWENVEFETPEGTFSGMFSELRVVHASDRLPDGRYIYDCRHGDDDWVTPITIEPRVVVNHAGTLMTEQPLPLKDGRLDVTDFWYTDGDRR